MYLFRNHKQLFTLESVFLISSCIFISCQVEEDSVINNPELIFSHAHEISVKSYYYIDSTGKEFFVNGDFSYINGIPDTLNSTPVLSWDTADLEKVTVAIFDSEIQVQDNQIANAEDIIWQWHTGSLLSGHEGYIGFYDGRPVENKNILYEKQPLPLKNGLYFWGVWGWNQEGTKIIVSSKPLSFYVE